MSVVAELGFVSGHINLATCIKLSFSGLSISNKNTLSSMDICSILWVIFISISIRKRAKQK